MRRTLQLVVLLFALFVRDAFALPDRARLVRATDKPKHNQQAQNPAPEYSSGSTNANASTNAGTNTTVSRVKWEPCPSSTKPFSLAANSSVVDALQCARITVPVQYSDPTGPSISLGLVRLPLNLSAPGVQRIGNLFINPGGPGLPASKMLVDMAGPLLPVTTGVSQSFDIIAMDPRGVGLSTPLKCDVTIENTPVKEGVVATTADGFDALFKHNKALGESCRARSALFMDHMDTDTVAQDLEYVRVALGSEPMNYLGQGYGSQLGAQYLSRYPDKVRAMVFDGVAGRADTLAEDILVQSTTLDASIQYIFDRCEQHDDTAECGGDLLSKLGSTSPGIMKNVTDKPRLRDMWKAIIDHAGSGDLSVNSTACDGTEKTLCAPRVTVGTVLANARTMLQLHYLPEQYPRALFGQALVRAARVNDASTLADRVLSSSDDYTNSQAWAARNVACLDGSQVAGTTPEDLQNVALSTRTFATNTPGVGEFWSRMVGCTGWPAGPGNNVPGFSGVRRPMSENPIHMQRARLNVSATPNPVLIVQNVFDPVGSLVYAQALTRNIDKSRLLIRQGLGSATYFMTGDCSSAIDAYLTKLTVPGPGTVYVS